MTQVFNGNRHMFGSSERPHQLWRSASRYALAIVVTLIAFAATLGLKHEWPAPIFLFFVLAVALSAWYGGCGPSVSAAALSLLLTKYAFKEPVGTLRINQLSDLIPFVVFLVVALMITATIEALRRSRGLAESRAAELGRVNEEMRHALVSQRLLAAAETERRRIARVLHEDVGQLLFVEQALGEGRLPEPIETAAFRIVQQALTNIARHAQAKSVHIALRRDLGDVELAIADDGVGFDVGDARARSYAGESLGLVHMTELAYMAGGVLSMNSTRGRGSTVHVQFPVSSVE